MTIPDKARRILFLIWWFDLAFVVAGSLVPGFLLESVHLARAPLGDKAFHFLAYTVLGTVPGLTVSSRLRVLISVLMLATLGLVLEFAQTVVPGRTFDFSDFHANNLGLVTGAVAGFWARRLAVRCFFRPESAARNGKTLGKKDDFNVKSVGSLYL